MYVVILIKIEKYLNTDEHQCDKKMVDYFNDY
jgi:hypothetical protein